MTLEVTQVFMRPNLETPWFQDTLPESHYNYIRTTYSGKVKGLKQEISDGMMLSITFTFTDFDAQQEFVADTYLREKVAQRDVYNAEHDILQIA